ncbi:MAG: ParB/RepB/Spo0J family partition protein, partial [Microcystaceae cyanobacterium]
MKDNALIYSTIVADNHERENLNSVKKVEKVEQIQQVEIEVLPPLSGQPPEALASNGQGWVNPRTLKPHPRNVLIYGQDEDVSDLIELIERSQWVKPLIVSPSGTIISGHRRWKAALVLELEAIPVEVRAFADSISELEALLLENASRLKTTEQKVREAQTWEEVEREKARQRQIKLAGTRPNTQPDLVANLPQGEKGKTRDRVALRVGMKARTYEKAAQVVNLIDTELDSGNQESAQGLRKILNEQSVDAAYQLLKYEDDKRSAILEKIVTGKAKTPSQAAKFVQSSSPARIESSEPNESTPIETEEPDLENCPP